MSSFSMYSGKPTYKECGLIVRGLVLVLHVPNVFGDHVYVCGLVLIVAEEAEPAGQVAFDRLGLPKLEPVLAVLNHHDRSAFPKVEIKIARVSGSRKARRRGSQIWHLAHIDRPLFLSPWLLCQRHHMPNDLGSTLHAKVSDMDPHVSSVRFAGAGASSSAEAYYRSSEADACCKTCLSGRARKAAVNMVRIVGFSENQGGPSRRARKASSAHVARAFFVWRPKYNFVINHHAD